MRIIYPNTVKHRSSLAIYPYIVGEAVCNTAKYLDDWEMFCIFARLILPKQTKKYKRTTYER